MKTTFVGVTLMLTALTLTACSDRAPEPAAAAASTHETNKLAGIDWFVGAVDAAFGLARTENKPVLLYWGADWCPYCESLKATVFTRPDFIEQSRRVIPIYLNGDLPEAQKWGTEFKVVGYPTSIILRPDCTEITRVAGGMDLTKYASVLEQVLEDERPIAEILAAPSTPEDCRRLACHAWDLTAEDGGQETLRKLATDLTTAAARCSVSEPDAQARLSMHALSLALNCESEAIEEGKAASAALTEQVRATVPVPVTGCLHLKTAVTSLGDNVLLINPQWVSRKAFAKHDLIDGATDEPMGANALWVGNRLLMSASYPRTIKRVEKHGLAPRQVDISEFHKAEGGLTCLSILLQAA